MEQFITADTHFSHTNIIEYCNRPFKDVSEMNRILIDNWNYVVSKKDEVYILGDFGMGNPTILYDEVMSKLNGTLFFIKGNHDKSSLSVNKKHHTFSYVKDYVEIKHDGHKLCLFHYPIEEWNGKNHNSIHLHGHSHGNGSIIKNRYDVGIDVNDYEPITLSEAIHRVEKQNETIK